MVIQPKYRYPISKRGPAEYYSLIGPGEIEKETEKRKKKKRLKPNQKKSGMIVALWLWPFAGWMEEVENEEICADNHEVSQPVWQHPKATH